ncbi:MAG: class I SAM-dependent methyltransferase [Alphaproteobacteria bacterium]|nr:class I SAM-dependent methyltransferase [Alphaproteobacteria bacterium]
MFFYNLIVCTLSVLFWLYILYALWEMKNHRAPFVPSPNAPKKLAFIKISNLLAGKKINKTVIDAGCGNGSMLAKLAQQHPRHRFIGIEYNKNLYTYCLHRYKKIPNLTFLHQDLLEYDYNQADIIYYFGFPELTKNLQEKLLNTQKKIDLIALDATFDKLTLIDKENFRFWLTKSYIYHYKN